MSTPRSIRALLAVAAFMITVAALVPSALSLPQHGDEAQYVWSGVYYGNRLVRWDFRIHERPPYGDPGFSPHSWWAKTQPMGARAIYALTVWATQSKPPARPYSYTDASLRGADSMVPSVTLPVVRFAAIVCAALGFALMALRWGWPALVAIVIFLLIPYARQDLARAWAEGPLLLGFGIAAIAYRTRWFAAACGLAATFKLTALGLWPLAFWHGLGEGRRGHLLALLATLTTWTALTPPSWFAGGPAFLLPMLSDRRQEFAGQSLTHANAFGLFLPSRYLWPFELALLLALCLAVSHVGRRGDASRK